MFQENELYYFKKECANLGLDLTEEKEWQFALFFERLIEKNKVMNLTAITDEHEVIVKHFLDSLSLCKAISPESGQKVLDMGCGAGFPGIPLKIMYPDTHFTLCDSLKKRISFLEEAAADCKLSGIDFVHARAEDLGRDPAHRESYDICVSRAVASLPLLLEYCLPFVKVGGLFVAYKSINIDVELKEAERAVSILGGNRKENVRFHLGDGELERSLLVIEKIRSTPKGYPRKAGVPKRNPL